MTPNQPIVPARRIMLAALVVVLTTGGRGFSRFGVQTLLVAIESILNGASIIIPASGVRSQGFQP